MYYIAESLSDTCVRDVIKRKKCDQRVVRCNNVKMKFARWREQRKSHVVCQALEKGGREGQITRSPNTVWILRRTRKEVR